MNNIQRVEILGVPVSGYTYETWLAQIDNWLTNEPNQVHQICTVNPEFLVMAQSDPAFFDLLNRVSMCVPDGVGLLWAARQLKEALPGRVTGSDGIPQLAKYGSSRGWRVFFLGAAEGIAEQAVQKLLADYPDLQVSGMYAGSPSAEDAPAIIEMVNNSQTDILLVAYGAPRQDLWIDKYKDQLNVTVALGVGGAFDFIAGIVPRAPHWMRRLGIEWLFRLYKQPWRWRRMLRLPLFMWLVWRHGHNAIPKPD